MSTHTTDGTANESTAPTARAVGPHRVVTATDRVPGAHPESHLRECGQTDYAERYLRCRRCGAERLRRRDFPAECAEVNG